MSDDGDGPQVETYDFGGDQPADMPAYELSSDHLDFTDEPLDRPTVIGTSPAGGPGVAEVARTIITWPFRVIGGVFGSDDGSPTSEDGDTNLEEEEDSDEP